MSGFYSHCGYLSPVGLNFRPGRLHLPAKDKISHFVRNDTEMIRQRILIRVFSSHRQPAAVEGLEVLVVQASAGR